MRPELPRFGRHFGEPEPRALKRGRRLAPDIYSASTIVPVLALTKEA
jgi:hypothetical protein